MDFATSAISVGVLVALCIPGYILIKTKLLTTKAIPVLVSVLLYVNQPFLTLYTFQTKVFEESLLYNMGMVLLLALLTQLIMLVLARTVFLIDKNNLPRARAYSYTSSFANVGFMGIPMAQVLLPNSPEALLYIAIYVCAFNLIAWTLGIYLLSGNKKYISIKKAIFNPPTVMLIIALPMFFCSYQLPQEVLNPIRYLAEMNTPLSMIILGMRLGDIRFLQLFKGLGVYVSCVLKLVVAPLIIYALMLPFGLDKTVMVTMYMLTAMPAASMSLLTAEKYGGDVEAASKSILLTTLFSIVSVPVMLLLL